MPLLVERRRVRASGRAGRYPTVPGLAPAGRPAGSCSVCGHAMDGRTTTLPARVPAAARVWTLTRSAIGTRSATSTMSSPRSTRAAQLGQLGGVAADVQVDAAHAPVLVGRGGHPHGGVDDDPSVADPGGQRGELLRVDRGQVEQHVDRLADPGADVACGVVDDLVGSVGLDPVLGVCTRRGDDVGTGGLGQLHGVASYGTAGAVDEDPLPGLEVRVLEECLPGGEPDQGEGGRVGQAGCCSGQAPGWRRPPRRTRRRRRRRRRAGTRSPGHPPAARRRPRRALRRFRPRPGRGCAAAPRASGPACARPGCCRRRR